MERGRLTRNGDGISAVSICTSTAVHSEMERDSYAMVKKDVMSIKSFYTTLRKKRSFGQVFDVCSSILVSKCELMSL